jgi:sphingosine kinase
MLIRSNVSRFRGILMLLGIETGNHVGMPGCEFIECSAYRLEPDPTNLRTSRNNIDGEPVEDGMIQACVIPTAARVFCSP